MKSQGWLLVPGTTVLFTDRSIFYKHCLITERQVSNYTMPCNIVDTQYMFDPREEEKEEVTVLHNKTSIYMPIKGHV